ncbi:MAG: oligosaccharide flippase family protein [Pyrinomonadaceae bacterium]
MSNINHSKNSIFTLLSWLVPLGLTFFATPYIVRGLGNVEYGLYALMLGFIAYSFTFNIGRAVTKYVVEYNATGETEKVTHIISATFFLGLTVGTIGSLILFLSSEYLVKNILLIDASLSERAITGLHLVALTIWILLIAQVFSAVVQATHRYDIYSLITAVSNFFLIIGNVFLVWRGGDFLYLVSWNIFTTFFNGLCFFYFARKLQPGTTVTFQFTKEIVFLSLKYGLSIAGYQLFANILFIFERIIITRIEGTDTLTNYVVPMTLAIFIHSFISSLTMNLMAYTSELFAQKKIAELEQIYRRISKIVVALVVFMCVSLAVGSKYFLTNWIDSKFAEVSSGVFIIQLFTFGLLACLIISWQFIEGFGQPFYNTVSGFSWFIIAMLLMPTLTSNFGIVGTAWARFLGEMTIPLTIALIERKIFGKILVGFWVKVMSILSLSAVAAGLVEYNILRYFSVNWLSFIFAIAVCAIVYAGLLLITSYFSKVEKIWIESLVRKVFA